MSSIRERYVNAGGRRCRVWERGEGRSVFWLASPVLLYRWTAIHEALSQRVRLVVCSLPGFPGNERNHEDLDGHLDWCLAAHDLLVAAGFKPGDILMGSSTAGALAADVAAIWPEKIAELVLVAPHGLFDSAEPSRDMFAMHPRDVVSLISNSPAAYQAQVAAPEGKQPTEWSIEVTRANEASARFLWPLGDTRLLSRLSRIAARTCILWGELDRILPPSYASRFAACVATVEVSLIPGAGHAAEIDAPQAIANAVVRFLQAGSHVTFPSSPTS